MKREAIAHTKMKRLWNWLPARQYEKDGGKTWAPLVEFTTKEARAKFQASALTAADTYMGGAHE